MPLIKVLGAGLHTVSICRRCIGRGQAAKLVAARCETEPRGRSMTGSLTRSTDVNCRRSANFEGRSRADVGRRTG
jgi:tRNA U54 and U55 pseudouridine synthase Pus10